MDAVITIRFASFLLGPLGIDKLRLYYLFIILYYRLLPFNIRALNNTPTLEFQKGFVHSSAPEFISHL